MNSNSAAFRTKPTALMVVVHWLFRYSNPATALASQATHWRYDTEDVLQLTLTRTAVTYILNFTAAATTSRIATRWQRQKRGYASSSIAQISNKRALERGVPVISLVFCQLLFGSAYGLIINLRENSAFPSHELLHLAGAWNALGHCSTMFSTGLIPTTLAHMLRSTESLFIAALLVSSGHQKLSFWSTVSIVVVFIGVYLESVEEMNRTSMSSEKFISLLGNSLALMSNVNLGMRALAVKSYNSTSDVKASYYTVCSYGAICLLPAFCWVNKSMLILTCPENIVACIFHLIYSEASFYVLSKVDAASHGFIKMGSRVAIVLSTAVAFKFEITPLRTIGLLLISSGIISYVFGKPKSSSEFEFPQYLLKRTRIAVLATCIMLIISTSYLSPPAGQKPNIRTFSNYFHFE